jgi:hypothetical protein
MAGSVRYSESYLVRSDVHNWPAAARRRLWRVRRPPMSTPDPKATVANGSSMDGISTSGPMGRMSWPRDTRVQLTLVFGRIEMA